MKEEMKVIMDLMQELQEKMAYGPDDMSERLGRVKPAAVEMEVSMEEPEDGEYMEEEESMDPEDKLKSRLMKMRG